LSKKVGPDGYERTEDEERRINLMAVEVLGDAAGQNFMAYIKSITTERVSGPNIDPNHLMHLEGMRYLAAVLSKRIDLGHKEKSRV